MRGGIGDEKRVLVKMWMWRKGIEMMEKAKEE